MSAENKKWTVLNYIQAFFPLQLVLAHLKYNLFSLLFWLALFLFVNDSLGYSFGIPLLFMSPEYLGEVSAWSFFLLGFAIGGFIMGFNTYSYMKLGPHFPFLTTLAKPFLKFCINNAFIPLTFTILVLVRIYQFQTNEELLPATTTLFYLTAYITGIAIFVALSFLYFFRFGRTSSGENTDKLLSKPISSVIHKREKWFDRFRINTDKVSLYFGKGMRLIRSRSSKHFDQQMVERVFAQNKINASVFELLTISVFFLLGAFNGYEIFEVPASVSIVLLLTIFQMLFSALHSWFRGWVYPIMIIVLYGMNFMSEKTGMFNYTNYAYGLDYSQKNDSYSIQTIQDISSNKALQQDSKECYLETLNAWKTQTKEEKPKLIIINTSGGGSRSALWTMIVLQNADKELNGKLSRHTQLITGASGGMIGAAYFRELLLRKHKGEIKDVYSPQYSKNISKDMLNKLSFMASTNDIFIRYQKFSYNDFSYTEDRGYAFEEQLHKNTNNLLQHSLGYYEKHERNGTIPTMIFSPTIINDGRRLLIGSQHLNFLTKPQETNGLTTSNENIDYHTLLNHQNTQEIRFSTVLRANATFPFVMPMITLPTEPEIQLMDAGIRDNYGVKTMMGFLFSMKEWIKENTSGVIVLQIRDTKKILDNERYTQVSFIDKITLPFGNMYKNFPRVQDFNHEELIQLGAKSLDFPIDLVSFNLREKQEDRISLSWHLTKQEKKRIIDAFKSRQNKHALAQLKRIL